MRGSDRREKARRGNKRFHRTKVIKQINPEGHTILPNETKLHKTKAIHGQLYFTALMEEDGLKE